MAERYYDERGPQGDPLRPIDGGYQLRQGRAHGTIFSMQSERYGPHDVFSAVLVVDQDAAQGPPALLYNISRELLDYAAQTRRGPDPPFVAQRLSEVGAAMAVAARWGLPP